MVVLSKYEYNLINRMLRNHEKCDIVHDGSCLVNVFKILPGIVAANGKFFIPMIILQLLMHIKKLNKEVFLDALKYYIGLVYSGTTVAFLCFSFHCFFRYILGGFRGTTLIMLPAICSSTILLKLGTKRAMQLFITSTFQSFIETKLMHRDTFLTRVLFDSVTLQALSFMCCSTLILHAKQNNLYKGFWFMQPTPKPKNNNNREQNNCCHENFALCRQYFVKGFRINIAVGLTLDLFRGLTNKNSMYFDSFFAKLLWKLRRTKLNMSAFLTSYVLIYRIANCYLLNNINGSPESKHLMAAFLGGISYIFYPNLSVLVYAMVISGQILWAIFNSMEKTRFEFLKKLPLLWFLFPTSLGYLTQTLVYRNEVSKLAEDMMNNLTNNKSRLLMLKIQGVLKRERTFYPKLLL